MSKYTTLTFVIFSLCSCISVIQAQNGVSINTSGASAHSSAILDVQSTTKGMLVPRMDSTQRTMISNAAPGLLVYDTDTESFWFRDSEGWAELVSSSRGLRDADQDTRVEVEASPDEDTIRFVVAGSEMAKMDGKTFHLKSPGNSLFIGSDAGINDDGSSNNNTAVGFEALYNTTTGEKNTAVGHHALFSNVGGVDNCAFGTSALENNSTGSSNVALGLEALNLNTSGHYNAAVGNWAMLNNTSGEYNTAVGIVALRYNTTGTYNVALGSGAMLNNETGSHNIVIGAEAGLYNNGNMNTMVGHQAGRGFEPMTTHKNVFLGFQAGISETGSEKLYIANSASSFPLIYGDFQTDVVGINGSLGIGTQSPAHPLDVRINGTDSVQTIVGMLQSTISKRPLLLFSENTSNDLTSGMSIEYNGAASTNEMYINKVGGESMITFESSGDVGIGTTNPLAPLHINASMGTHAFRIDVEDLTKFLVGDNGGVTIGSATTPPANGLFVNGNAGVGIFTPETKLHIAGGTDAGLAGGGYLTIGETSDKNLSFDNNEIMARLNGTSSSLHLQVDGGGVSIGTSTSDSKVNIQSSAGEDPLRARVEGATKLLVHNNGGTAIGVNTTPPANGLHVEGNIRIDGTEIVATDTLRLRSNIRIELLVGAHSIIIDPFTGITITSGIDITFNAGDDVNLFVDDRIYMDAVTEIELNSGTVMDLNATGNFTLNSDAMIDLDAGTELELNGNTIDINSDSSIEIDGTGTVDIDGLFVRLDTEGNSTAQAAIVGSNVDVPACPAGCDGTVTSGSATVLIGD